MVYVITGLIILAYGSARRAIDFNKKDKAKPPARRGFIAYASESGTTNLQSSIYLILNLETPPSGKIQGFGSRF